MEVFAHRGYSGMYPENTMLAFKKAVEAGCNGIELDVHETRDGRLVIIHDEYVDRTTDGRGRVMDHTFDELRRLNAAKLFPNVTEFEPVPSLEEYCGWVSSHDIKTNIEIKTDNIYYPDIEKKILDTVYGFGIQNRVIFSSFNHISLIRIKEMAPKSELGALVEKENFVRVFPGAYCKKSGFNRWHPAISMLDEENARDCRRNGIKINVWTVNDMAGMEKALRLGCSAVITNFPGIAAACVKGLP